MSHFMGLRPHASTATTWSAVQMAANPAAVPASPSFSPRFLDRTDRPLSQTEVTNMGGFRSMSNEPKGLPEDGPCSLNHVSYHARQSTQPAAALEAISKPSALKRKSTIGSLSRKYTAPKRHGLWCRIKKGAKSAFRRTSGKSSPSPSRAASPIAGKAAASLHHLSSRSSTRSRRSNHTSRVVSARMTTTQTPTPAPSSTLHQIQTAGLRDGGNADKRPSIMAQSPQGTRTSLLAVHTVQDSDSPVSDGSSRRSVRISHPVVSAVLSAPSTPATMLSNSSSSSPDSSKHSSVISTEATPTTSRSWETVSTNVSSQDMKADAQEATPMHVQMTRNHLSAWLHNLPPAQKSSVTYLQSLAQCTEYKDEPGCQKIIQVAIDNASISEDGAGGYIGNASKPTTGRSKPIAVSSMLVDGASEAGAQRPNSKRASMTMPFIAMPPRLSGDFSAEFAAATSTDADSSYSFSKRTSGELKQHRTDTLAALHGLGPSSDRIPIAHPIALTPGSQPKPALRHRPYTLATTTIAPLPCITYSGPFAPYGPPEPTPTKAGAKRTSSTSSNVSSPDPFSPEVSSADHRANYTRIESGIMSPGPSQGGYFTPVAPVTGGAPMPPPSPPPHVSTTAPNNKGKGKQPAVDSPIPASLRPAAKKVSNAELNKPLPAAPGPGDHKRFTGGYVPVQVSRSHARTAAAPAPVPRATLAPVSRSHGRAQAPVKMAMNENGYPIMTRQTQTQQKARQQIGKKESVKKAIGQFFTPTR